MDSINGIRTFIKVVEEGSFTTAGERMNMSVSLVSKYIRQLENRLGIRLLNRTTRSITLTEIGTIYFERSQLVLQEFDSLEESMKDKHSSPCGNLVISAPLTFGEMFLTPLIEEFLEKYPDISIDLQLSDKIVDLASEAVDVSIRIAELPDSNLVARYLEPARIICCASEDYLKKFGMPKHPNDLINHECVIDKNFQEPNRWPFLIEGERKTFNVNGRFAVNSARSTREMVLAGKGISMIPAYAIIEDIQTGRIKVLMKQHEAFDLGIYLVYLHRRHLAVKVRVFVDFIASKFEGSSAWST